MAGRPRSAVIDERARALERSAQDTVATVKRVRALIGAARFLRGGSPTIIVPGAGKSDYDTSIELHKRQSGTPSKIWEVLARDLLDEADALLRSRGV